MNFKVGDKIIYPNHGLAIIEDIQEKSIFGEKSIFFQVRILSNDTLVLVPADNTKDMGIRKPILEEEVKEVFNLLENGDIELIMNWKGRYKEHIDKMTSGSIYNTVVVFKNLFYLNLIKPLSFREKKMMERAKRLIVCEISEVKHVPYSEIEKKIDEILTNCFKDFVPSDNS
ncbi:MAG: CarD family transcriptional regulator [Candidatus Aminicenantia bacterium]